MITFVRSSISLSTMHGDKAKDRPIMSMSFLLYSSIGYLVKSKESKSLMRIELNIEG